MGSVSRKLGPNAATDKHLWARSHERDLENVRWAQKTQCITPEENAAACQSVGRTWNTRNKTPLAPSKTCAENSAQL